MLIIEFQAVVEEEIDMRRRFFTEDKRTKFDYNNYLTIEALEDNVEVVLPRSTTEYGIDGYGWEFYTDGIFLAKGQLLSLRGDITYLPYGTIQITGKCNLLGNCLSLFYKDNAKQKTSIDGMLIGLFKNCVGIKNVSENFLPATTLRDSCYLEMFMNCSSLITPPRLPATTLAPHCYSSMFSGCSKLNYIKMLATDISAFDCLYYWVFNVAPSGTFVKNPEATWEKYGINGIPDGWKVVMDGEEKELIKFYFFNNSDEIVLYAEQGMTWGEWINSEYKEDHPFGVDILDEDAVTYAISYYVGDDYGYISTSDIIVEDAYYFVVG